MTSPRTSQRNIHACARTIVTLQQQDGGYALLWKRYDNNKWACCRCIWVYCCCCRCILHLQQYSRRLNLFFIVFCWAHLLVDTVYSYCTLSISASVVFPLTSRCKKKSLVWNLLPCFRRRKCGSDVTEQLNMFGTLLWTVGCFVQYLSSLSNMPLSDCRWYVLYRRGT